MKRNSSLLLWILFAVVLGALITVSIPMKRGALEDIQQIRQMGGFRRERGRRGPPMELPGNNEAPSEGNS